jgi:hypothetical protein
MFTVQNCNQDTPTAELFSTHKVPLITAVDCDGDIDMGQVEDVVAGVSSGTGSTASPSDSTAVILRSVECRTDQRQEICFGMVRSKYWPS